jgi:hypothetical protein
MGRNTISLSRSLPRAVSHVSKLLGDLGVGYRG